MCLEFALKCTCSLICKNNPKPVEVSDFLGWPRPRQLYNYSSKYGSHIHTIFCKASYFFLFFFYLQWTQQKPKYKIDSCQTQAKPAADPTSL